MALIKCRECGKEISKTAKTCPNCGAKNKNRPTSPIAWLVVIILIVFSIGFICNVFFSSKTTPQTTSYQSSEPPPIDVAPGMTPDQLKAATLHLRKKLTKLKILLGITTNIPPNTTIHVPQFKYILVIQEILQTNPASLFIM